MYNQSYRLVHSFTCACLDTPDAVPQILSVCGTGNCGEQLCLARYLYPFHAYKKNISSAVYSKQGYMDLVQKAAEGSMSAAIGEVESLSHYQEKGEVMKCIDLKLSQSLPFFTDSGLLLMQSMTLLPMPTTQQCLACLEGIFVCLH